MTQTSMKSVTSPFPSLFIMLVVIFLMAAFNAASSAPGISSHHNFDPPILLTILGRELPPCVNVVRCRDLQDIIWSCLATIFACTWVAVHPNVPSSCDSDWKKLNQKLLIMVYALLVPEFITMWALRQRIGAGKHVEEYNEKFFSGHSPRADSIFSTVKAWFRSPAKNKPDGRWTITHGFLLEMRGLELGPGDIVEEVDHIPASFNITEEEINDKSKGDFLTKLLVVLQTTWFIFQCLVRWIMHLPVAELEVVTLAFAFLNIVTYVLWWKKPQNMGITIAMHRYLAPMDLPETEETKGLDISDSTLPEAGGEICREGEAVSGPRLFGRVSGGVRRLLAKAVTRLRLRSLADVRLDKVAEFVMAPIRPLMAMLSNNDGDSYMFYSSQNGMVGWEMFVPICIIGTAFGALHLMPLWLSSFPSSREEHLWKLSAIWITAEPFVLLCSRSFGELPLADLGEIFVVLSTLFVYFGLIVSLLLYMVARLALVVLAFTTLRGLPPDTYRDIPWSSFIPHL